MKRFSAHQVGVDQGRVDLFSDFSSGGDMWTGEGSRERRRRIEFSAPFLAPPSVQLALSLWDMDTRANVRADLAPENIDEHGFDMVFHTWGDSRVARVRVAWLAIGALASEDDWAL